jgi:hypothetical protein
MGFLIKLQKQPTTRSKVVNRLIPIFVLVFFASVQPLFAGSCSVGQGATYNRAKLNAALKCLNSNLVQSQAQVAALKTDIAELQQFQAQVATLKADVAELQAEILALKGLVPPMEPVNMYEDNYVRIQLTGAGKTITDPVNHEADLHLRLLITNKTTDILYLAHESYTSNVADENGITDTNDQMTGIKFVGASETNGNYYSAIGAGSSITASWTNYWNRNFYNAHFIDASFGFVRYEYGGNTRFSAGFSGIVVP